MIDCRAYLWMNSLFTKQIMIASTLPLNLEVLKLLGGHNLKPLWTMLLEGHLLYEQ